LLPNRSRRGSPRSPVPLWPGREDGASFLEVTSKFPLGA